MTKQLTDRSWYGIGTNDLNKSVLQEQRNYGNAHIFTPKLEQDVLKAK